MDDGAAHARGQQQRQRRATEAPQQQQPQQQQPDTTHARGVCHFLCPSLV
jgi:hypothetical protein